MKLGANVRYFVDTVRKYAQKPIGYSKSAVVTSTQEYLAKYVRRNTLVADTFIASSKKQGATIIGDVILEPFGRNRLITKRLPSGTTVTVRIDNGKLVGKEVISKKGRSFSFFDDVVNANGKKTKSVQAYVEKNDGSSILKVGDNVYRSSTPINYSLEAPLLASSAGMTESARALEAPVDPKKFNPFGSFI